MSDANHITSSYNRVSGGYNGRYEQNPLPGVAATLRDLVAQTGARRVLEVGCGTGHWLETLAPDLDLIVGLDPSTGMLTQAQARPGQIDLVQGRDDALPFADGSFDLVYVVNALHHFNDKPGFPAAVKRLLRPGGALALIGHDVPSALGHWTIYEYFPETIDLDRARYPLWSDVQAWMTAAGYSVQPLGVAEQIHKEYRGRTVLSDHFMQRGGTSQLFLLTDAQYQAGIDRITRAIEEAESRSEEAIFRTDIQLYVAVGRV
ncbi:MAG: class I SAM-dependent methyltransferase [Chloroflexi bacterium]|uniref:class I SAM-dependent methyltransferase n=1 Tax=Candidatus Flexifilum breve TaxID=3140694 RepID=UPI00313550E7|nr:class I SAM-dependent methyltransferase [Chloroflexota bacterium]